MAMPLLAREFLSNLLYRGLESSALHARFLFSSTISVPISMPAIALGIEFSELSSWCIAKHSTGRLVVDPELDFEQHVEPLHRFQSERRERRCILASPSDTWDG